MPTAAPPVTTKKKHGKKKKATITDTVGGVISQVAEKYGVPPAVALATAFHESSMKPTATGDHGYFDSSGYFHPDASSPPTSFGEYQLHERGKLGNLSAGAAFDVFTNASVAIPGIAAAKREHPGITWGQAAAMSQGPADKVGYAAAVDGLLSQYHHSGLNPIDYFAKLTPYAKMNVEKAQSGAVPDIGSGTPKDRELGGNNPVTGGGNNSANPSDVGPPVNDWLAALDKLMNPGGPSGLNVLNPFADSKYVGQLVLFRGGVGVVGVILIGAGILLMFGKDIFGGAVMAIPGVGEVAGAAKVAGVATRAAGAAKKTRAAATVAKTAATEG